MNQHKFTVIGGIIIIVALVLLLNSFFTINEGHRALMLRLGSIVREQNTDDAKIYAPGLHWKVPFIVNVRKFDVRLQDLEDKSPRILTKEQKYLYVDYYAKWHIKDLPLYYTRTGGISNN